MRFLRDGKRTAVLATGFLLAVVSLSFVAGFALHGQTPSAGANGKTIRVDTRKGTSVPAHSVAPVPRACAAAMQRGRDDDNRATTDLEVLMARGLSLPIAGIRKEQLVDSFSDGRGARKHEALDIQAPRDTPVVAVDDGCVVKQFKSVAGGTTLYQFDPEGRFVYYYAHLERYADGVNEGTVLKRGELIGYVGTSGNAPPNTPHLHFAIFRLGPEKKWWRGTPVNPFKVFSGQR